LRAKGELVIRTILVGVDGSAHAGAARDHAVALARLYQARVVGLHVLDVRLVEMPPFLASAYVVETAPASTMPVEILAGFRENGDRLLEEFREAAGAAGIEVELRLEEGVPAQTLAEVADGHDLLVIGKRGAHARWGDQLVGSTAELVVRSARSPVLLAEREGRPIGRLALLYDGSHASKEALKFGADLAATLGASLTVLTGAAELDEAGGEQAKAKDYLAAFSLPVEYRIFSGDVVLGALTHIEEEKPDLLVLGRHGHSRLRSFILGSTTGELLHRARTPVLLVS
jgi:nucleotide-binding universal stress UspA family protein